MTARVALAMLLLGACVTQIPRPTESDVLRAASQRPATTLVELERGRTLYVARCGGCHQVYPPDRLTPATWPAQVDDMAERAKLGADDRDLVVLFLVTLSTRKDRP